MKLALETKIFSKIRCQSMAKVQKLINQSMDFDPRESFAVLRIILRIRFVKCARARHASAGGINYKVPTCPPQLELPIIIHRNTCKMFMFQNMAILRHFNNFTHIDQLTMVTHGDPFSVVTFPRPGASCIKVQLTLTIVKLNSSQSGSEFQMLTRC